MVFLKAIGLRLTDEDRRLLGEVFAPRGGIYVQTLSEEG